MRLRVARREQKIKRVRITIIIVINVIFDRYYCCCCCCFVCENECAKSLCDNAMFMRSSCFTLFYDSFYLFILLLFHLFFSSSSSGLTLENPLFSLTIFQCLFFFLYACLSVCLSVWLYFKPGISSSKLPFVASKLS